MTEKIGDQIKIILEKIQNIDKIILDNKSYITEAYFNYDREIFQSIEKGNAKRENREERFITIEEVKSKNKENEIKSVHALVYPYNLTEVERDDVSPKKRT